MLLDECNSDEYAFAVKRPALVEPLLEPVGPDSVPDLGKHIIDSFGLGPVAPLQVIIRNGAGQDCGAAIVTDRPK